MVSEIFDLSKMDRRREHTRDGPHTLLGTPEA